MHIAIAIIIYDYRIASTKFPRDKTYAVRSPWNFMLASNQHPQVPKHLEIHGKTFAVQAKLGPRMFCTQPYKLGLSNLAS